MINYNHYLKEIGIKNNEYPFLYGQSDCVEPSRWEPDEEGFIAAEFWSLDYVMACYIYSHLCYFRDYCLYSYPSDLTFEQ